MKKVLLAVAMAVVSVFTLFACGGNKPLVIWVGTESLAFYQSKIEDYKLVYKDKNGEDFPHTIEVRSMDSGTAAGAFLADSSAGADIFTIPHDNLAKLTSGASLIAPLGNDLINQVLADNEDVFVDVTKSKVQGEEYYFGVPYISQALVLYYNKNFLSASDVQSWEGILAKANEHNKQALSLRGEDGYNNSFLLLAVEEATKQSSLEIYKDAKASNCNATGADVLSFMKYGQKVLFGNANGAKRPSTSGWQTEMKNEVSISYVSGAWDFSALKAALGSKLGVALLPQFTLTNESVYDVANNGDLVGKVYRSGTFADVKMFVKKNGSPYADYLDGIMAYLASKEVQEESFVAASNLPSYKNAVEEFEALDPTGVTDPDKLLELDLAARQIDMMQYGFPQPFGASELFNYYFYQKTSPALIMDLLDNQRGQGSLTTDVAILAQMTKVQNVWKTGNES